LRKQEEIIIWTAYFDSGKTRKEGRRVAKTLALPNPKIIEIETAAADLDLDHSILTNRGYPKTPWLQSGMLLVEKQGSKEKTINMIAKQLQKNRKENIRQVL
jgi:signal recognition particle subunit SEC65